VDVTPSHCIVVAIGDRTLHLGAPACVPGRNIECGWGEEERRSLSVGLWEVGGSRFSWRAIFHQ
jgi:hypothetical protein